MPPLDASVSGPKPTPLRLQTTVDKQDIYKHPSKRTLTSGSFTITYPETPSSAYPTPTTAHPENKFGSTTSFTFTPPQSAGPIDQPISKLFNFNSVAPNSSSPRTSRRRSASASSFQIPYTHPRSLHSILRNSPLPPRTSATPATPRRASMRLGNRAAKKVGYNDPLTQTIVTNKYIKSHIDLLSEDSPSSATDPESDRSSTFEAAMQYTGDETRDGGQTPGPFEEMRRRMAESGLETPAIRRRKRKDKKRKWRWTIGGDDTEEVDEIEGSNPRTAIESTPITTVYIGRSAVGIEADQALGEINSALPPEEDMPEEDGQDEIPLILREDSQDLSTDSDMSEFQHLRTHSLETTDSEMSDADERPGTSQSL